MPVPAEGQQGIFSNQVAHANSTLNTFMGGKRKQWMTDATPVQPSPRPARFLNPPLAQPRQPRQPPSQPPPSATSRRSEQPARQDAQQDAQQPLLQHHPLTITPANVLPSPAPSDEPSPSFSNPKDSPNPHSLSLAAASPRRQSIADTTAVPTEVLPPSTSSAPRRTSSTADAEIAATLSNPAVEQTASESDGRSSYAMPPPSITWNNQAGMSREASGIISPVPGQHQSLDLQSRAGSTLDERQNKRRRVEDIEHEGAGIIQQHRADDDRTVDTDPPRATIDFTTLASLVEQRIQALGGEQNLSPEVEQPRFRLLREACAKQDLFYLGLHNLFCAWSLAPRRIPSLANYDLDALSVGFAILLTLLKKNSEVSEQNLKWFASFPSPSFSQSRPGVISHSISQVAEFIMALSQHWTSLFEATHNRLYPFLMDELLGKLQCHSPIMQNILFTSCRRWLYVSDGALGTEASMYFEQDQRQHRDEHGQVRPVLLSSDPAEVERRNQALIRAYREIVAKARARAKDEAERLRSQLQAQHEQQRQQQAHQQTLQRHYQIQQQQRRISQVAQLQAQQSQQFPQSQMQNGGQQVFMTPQPPASVLLSQSRAAGTVSSSNSQWSQNHMPNQAQNTDASLTRGLSMTPTPMNVQLLGQFSARPPPPRVYSGAGSPTMPQSSFSPHTMARQLNQVPQHVGSPNSPTMQAGFGVPTTQAIPSTQNYASGVSGSQQYNSNFQQQAHDVQDSLRIRHYAPPGQFPAQWSAGMGSPTMALSPPMSTMQHHMPLPQANPLISPRHSGPRQNWVSQPRVSRQPQTVPRYGPAPTYNDGARSTPQKLVVPPPGYTIDRSEYPHTHQEKKALVMTLHQVQARSPDRTRLVGIDERYYQYVHSFAVAPFRLYQYHELQFEVSSDEHERLCKKTVLPPLGDFQASVPLREYTDGSLRFRVRCCRMPSDKQIAAPDWAVREMTWPDHIFIHFNKQKLVIRRNTHNGKDLPVELTDFVAVGSNALKVALSKEPTTPNRRGNSFYLAVEILKVASHTDILRNVENAGRIAREETLQKIRSRVTAAPDEDGIAVIDRTGVIARELSIDLTDPFSAKIFTIPARGATCTHMECFDLETWLLTRPIKQQIKCGHKDACCTCPKRLEPSEPDKWKCPICFGDARPESLRIDSFLEDVRKQLEEQDKLQTKSVLVAADGAWRPVVEEEEDDDDDAGSDGDGAVTQRVVAALRKSKGPSKSASVERAPEIIELD